MKVTIECWESVGAQPKEPEPFCLFVGGGWSYKLHDDLHGISSHTSEPIATDFCCTLRNNYWDSPSHKLDPNKWKYCFLLHSWPEIFFNCRVYSRSDTWSHREDGDCSVVGIRILLSSTRRIFWFLAGTFTVFVGNFLSYVNMLFSFCLCSSSIQCWKTSRVDSRITRVTSFWWRTEAI